MIPQPVIAPKPESKLVVGMIPCFNLFFLDKVWPIIGPGLEELANRSLGEFTPWSIRNKIYLGSLHLYMAYIDQEGTATEDKFQEIFAERLRTPEVGFVWFGITELRETSFHIYAAYIAPEYRGFDVVKSAMKYAESVARKAKAPALTLASEKDTAFKSLGFVETTTNYRKNL